MKHSGKPPKKKRACELNQATIETQYKSANLSLIVGINGHDQGNHDVNELGTVKQPFSRSCGTPGRISRQSSAIDFTSHR
ncbi:hypothetical protein O181_101511, partial [Austropuccinia psidii MF-1]|nr:hypothetical protein [Austropuccinia psidii MF-1]